MRKSLQHTSILIVRLGGMGDVVLANPVANAVKKHHPNSHIIWLVQSEFKTLLENHPAIDEIICWDKTNWKKLLKEKKFIALFRQIGILRKTLKSKNIDIALDLHGQFKSGLLTRFSSAKMRIALGSREGNNLFMTRTISRNLADQQQIGSEYRYLINQLGYPERPWTIHVPVADNPAPILEKIFQGASSQYAVICPFSSKAQCNWPDEYWQHLILRIRGRYQLKTLLLGESQWNSQAQQITKNCGAVNLCGELSTIEAATLINKASLIIGVDNGWTHMGHALNAPTISLFGPTIPYSHTGQETSTVIYLDKFCSPCNNKPICNGAYECMREITPDSVLGEIKSLMKNFRETPLIINE